MTVTGTSAPSSANTWVIPTFLPMIPSIAMSFTLEPVSAVRVLRYFPNALISTSTPAGQLELHERVDRLGRRLENVEQPLVRPHLELLPRLLVDVRAAQNRVARNLRRQRDRSRHLGAGALGRVDDLRGRLIEDAVVVRFETDADLFVHHDFGTFKEQAGPARAPALDVTTR